MGKSTIVSVTNEKLGGNYSCFLKILSPPEISKYKYNFTELQVSRVIIVLLLQNCFVWCKDHTHQAILTTELLELEGWQLNAKI